jgi:hypothetical protein
MPLLFWDASALTKRDALEAGSDTVMARSVCWLLPINGSSVPHGPSR